MERIKFKNFGETLVFRAHGSEVRNYILDALNDLPPGKRLIFDMNGVKAITSSFADECFAKLVQDFGEEIKNKTTFINANDFSRKVISESINRRKTLTLSM